MGSVTQTFIDLLGAASVVDWQAEPVCKAQIMQAVLPDAPIQCVVYPATPEQLSEVVACAFKNRWRMLTCGGGSKLHWGGLARAFRLWSALPG